MSQLSETRSFSIPENIENAAAYIRYSSERQSETSLEAQLDEIQNYCRAKNLQIVKVYRDAAYSAKDDNRPAFRELFDDVKRGANFKFVIVHAIDRWSRNLYHAAFYRALLHDKGIELLSVKEDITGGHGDLVFNIMASVADHYRKNLVREVVTKSKYVANKAYFLGGVPPYGYDLESVKDEFGKVRKRYVINDKEALVVRLIFELAAEGLSLEKIANTLNEKNLLNRDRPWKHTAIREMLLREKYKGIYTYAKGSKRNPHAERPDHIRVPNGVPAIVSAELFEKAQRFRKPEQSKRARRTRTKRSYLLLGLAYCYCGKPLTVVAGGKYPRYGCLDQREKRGHATVGKMKLENHVWNTIETFWLGDVDFEDLTAKLNATISYMYSKDSDSSLKKSEELLEINRQIDRAVKLLLSGSFLSQEIEDEMKRLKDRKSSLERQLRDEPTPKEHITVDELRKLWKSFEEIDQQEIIRSLVDKVTLTEKGIIHISWRFPQPNLLT